MIDYPQSLTANTKNQNHNSVVHKHAPNETHKCSKTERDTSVKYDNALYERGRLKVLN